MEAAPQALKTRNIKSHRLPFMIPLFGDEYEYEFYRDEEKLTILYEIVRQDPSALGITINHEYLAEITRKRQLVAAAFLPQPQDKSNQQLNQQNGGNEEDVNNNSQNSSRNKNVTGQKGANNKVEQNSKNPSLLPQDQQLRSSSSPVGKKRNLEDPSADKKRAGSSTPKPAIKKSRPMSFQEIQSIRYQFLFQTQVEKLTTPVSVKKKLIALLTESKNRIFSNKEIQNSFNDEGQEFLGIVIDELSRESRLQKRTVENQVYYMLPDGGREEEEGDVDFAACRYYYQDRATLIAGLELYNRRRCGICSYGFGTCSSGQLLATEMWFPKEVGEDNRTPCSDCGVGVSELGTEYFEDCPPVIGIERDHALCVGCMGRRLKKEAGTNLSTIQKSLIPLRRAQSKYGYERWGP